MWAVAWAAASEHVLATGGCEGSVRLWDVRRAGCLMVLDQHNAAPAATDAAAAHVAASGGGRPALLARSLGGLAPGAAGAAPTGRAHDGAVTSLRFMPCGRRLLSAGRDARLRLWDLRDGRNTMVHFAGTRSTARKACHMGLSSDGRLVAHPSGTLLSVYDTDTG